jgi:hypothetical protein
VPRERQATSKAEVYQQLANFLPMNRLPSLSG